MKENASPGLENLSREGGFNKKKKKNSNPVSNVRGFTAFALLLIVSISTPFKKIQFITELR